MNLVAGPDTSQHSTTTMASSMLPPDASGYDFVFTVSGSALIDASRDKVWSILMDFSSYQEWCVVACAHKGILSS